MAEQEHTEEFSEEELAAMSDEEREALGIESDEDDDDAAEEQDDATDEEADEADADEPEGEADADDVADDDGKPAADDKPAAADDAEVKDKAKAEPEPEQKQVKPDERLTDIDTSIEALGDKLEEGEIDFREYNRELAKLNNERQDLVVEIRDQQNAVKARAESWNTAVEDFLGADEGHKAVVDNPIIKNAFETALVQVSSTPEGQKATDAWRLNAAKEALVKAGIPLGKAKPADKTPPKSRKPDGETPVTLSEVPAAAENEDHSEFSHLNGLEGMELEKALAKLTPEQEARYLS